MWDHENQTLPLAPYPTPFPPGSEEKVRVMAARVAAGFAPCHPGDETRWDGAPATPLVRPPSRAFPDAELLSLRAAGLSFRVIADRLGVSPDRAKKRHRRVTKRDFHLAPGAGGAPASGGSTGW